MIQTCLLLFTSTTLGLLAFAGLLHLMPRLGAPGKAFARLASHAPLLDLVVFVFTVLPQVVAIVLGSNGRDAGWPLAMALLASAVLGQLAALLGWMLFHELAHRDAPKPRIYTVLNRSVGPVRNTFAVWWTLWAVPVFALIRIAEFLVYPFLVWTIKFPRYKQKDWVNVTRHKFDGLVGMDRIWCLYCDWMTGVWSLGGEMLRNVETFWCPIRFASPEKCENCQHDYPDLNGGWVDASASLPDVTKVLEEKYPKDSQAGENTWFGHKARLTINGKDPE